MSKVTKRLRQFMIALAAVLGLSVSSGAAACACSHHGEPDAPKRSCHQETSSHHPKNDQKIVAPVVDEDCVCVPQATKRSVKSEAFKLKKQPAFFENVFAAPTARFRASHLSSSDGFSSLPYRLLFSSSIFSRGPPAQ